MNTKLFAFLILLASFTTTLSAWAGYTFENGVLTVDGTIDLVGHPLTFEGMTSMTGNGAFTDSVGGAVLTLDLSPGEIKNGTEACKVKFTGNLRLCKQGLGTLNIASTTSGYETHSFTGGLEIRGGTVTTDKYAAMSKEETQFGKNAVIDVYEGGKIDLASPDHNKTTVNLYAGEITGPIKKKFSDGKQCAAKINLEADSTLKPTKQFGISGPINLKGHTLTISLQDKLEWKPSSITIGTILICKGTLTVVGNVSDSSANLTMTDTAGLSLGAYEYVVNDYIANSTGSLSGTGALKVSGTFTPSSDNFYPCTMMDGSTIDLSGKTSTWSLTNASGDGVKFAARATVTIDVGARTIAAKDKIVDWPEGTEYSGRTFVLKANGGISEDLELQVSATGLTVAARGAKVPTATWTGAIDSDAGKAGNWSWENVPEPTPGVAPIDPSKMLPGPSTAVVIPWAKLATFNWSEDIAYATIEFSGDKPTETVVLNGDRDWRGLGALDVPFALDLNGHKLYIVLPEGSSANETEVTSTAEGGELHATVATDKVHDNTSVALTGNLSLIKEGPGAFVATKYPQTYTGETIVNEGTLRAADGANVNADSTTAVTNSPFGASRTITVGPEGVLDPRGSYSWGYHTVNLDGGAISNTIERTGLSSDQYGASMSNPFNPDINLMQTSVFATEKTFNYQGKIFPNGNKLRIWIANGQTLVWNPNDKSSADIEVVSGGFLRTFSHGPVKTPNCSLVMAGGALYIGGVFEVSNYWASSSVSLYKYDARKASDDEDVAYLKVYGSFRPETDVFFACSIQDGASIDLSGKTSVWSTQTSATAVQVTSEYKGMKSDVTFADRAKVTIDVGSREFRGETQIVSWSEGSKVSAAGAKFVLSSAAKTRGYRLTRDENGLYVGRTGFVLLIQ